MLSTTLGRFRLVSFIEGVSFILLLGVAMPLKYIWNFPETVRVVGMLHGVLFITYGIFLVLCWMEYKWKFGTVVLLFFASLLPFGNFIAEALFLKKQHPQAS